VRAALVSRPALEISPQAAAWSLWVAVSVAVLWYLVTPTVREAFRASSLPKPAQG
jgi:hypothetical protein